MCKSFLLFGGALMDKECIKEWRKELKTDSKEAEIIIKGSLCTSKNLDVAIGYSKCHTHYSSDK